MPIIKQRFRRSPLTSAQTRIHAVFDDFHLLRMEGDYEYPLHQHINYEVILIESGPYKCSLNREEISLNSGQLLVVKPGDWHQDHLRDGQVHYVLHFKLRGSFPGFELPQLFRQNCLPVDQICFGSFSGQEFFLREIQEEAETARPYGAHIQDTLLQAFFWRIVRSLPRHSLSSEILDVPIAMAKSEFLQQVFLRHLRTNPTVLEIAKTASLSPRHLTELTKKLFQKSPARFLLELKLQKADELLRIRGLRVKEVSDQLGFSNPFHFSRVFRRYYKRAPSQT